MEHCTQKKLKKEVVSQKEKMDSMDGFKSLINQPSIQSILKQEIPEHRERIFTPLNTLYVFNRQIMNVKQSCRGALIEILPEHLIKTGHAFSTHTGAYCKARQRLPEPLISKVAQASGEYLETASSPFKWKGREVKLVDGTTVSMPDTIENQERYPQNPAQKKGIGFPIARMTAIISLSSGAVLDIAIGKYTQSEHELLRELLNRLTAGDILLGDRYFCSYFLLARLKALNIDAVFKMHANRKIDFRKVKP